MTITERPVSHTKSLKLLQIGLGSTRIRDLSQVFTTYEAKLRLRQKSGLMSMNTNSAWISLNVDQSRSWADQSICQNFFQHFYLESIQSLDPRGGVERCESCFSSEVIPIVWECGPSERG